MHELFAAFGIDWRLLLINLFNFGLLLWVLQRFLYKPLTTMLEKRRLEVIEGVHAAAAAKQHLEEVEQSRAGLLADAGREADEALAHAREAATQKGRELLAQSEASASALLKEADAQAHELKRQAIEESKKEVAKLIVLGMERVPEKA